MIDTTDDRFQKSIRDRVLKPFYGECSHEGRFVFVDKGRLAKTLQMDAVDTILQKVDNEIVSIEEKIVRWPGYMYQKFCLETWSCTNKGYERPGWMYTGKCDFLFYCFVQSNESVLGCLIPFSKLQIWFFENDRFKGFPVWISNQFNHTECRLTSIWSVFKEIPETQLVCLPPDKKAESNVNDLPLFMDTQ